MINWWSTNIGELEKSLLNKAFSEKKFSCGSYVREFEEQIETAMQVDHVIVSPSGTAALSIAMMALDLQPNDEVIVPNMTWIATAQAAANLGAKIILVDSMEDSPVLDVDKIENCITKKTKVVIPVHFHGRSCDMTKLQSLQQKYKFSIVEDACKAMFCKNQNKFLGTLGEMGCFSLGMISLISIGYGGFVVTNDDFLAKKCRLIRDHGMIRNPEKYLYPGANYKVSDLLLAIGKGQLMRIDEKKRHLQKVYQLYKDGLRTNEAVDVIPIDCENGIIPICVDLISEKRDILEKILLSNDIQISKFHIPLHKASYLGNYNDNNFPCSVKFSETGFMPPCGPSQDFDNVHKTIEIINNFKE